MRSSHCHSCLGATASAIIAYVISQLDRDLPPLAHHAQTRRDTHTLNTPGP